MIKDMSFGALLREVRLKNKVTLRQYCLQRGLDIGNVSKLERNLIAPPNDNTKLLKYLNGLKYTSLEYEFLLTAAVNYQIGRIVKKFDYSSHGRRK
jgi:transcriptional regulator with XRE-family HTH domain